MRHYWVKHTGCYDVCWHCGIRKHDSTTEHCKREDYERRQKECDTAIPSPEEDGNDK